MSEKVKEMAGTILSVKNLSKHFIIKKNVFSPKKVINAVNDISFDIFPNESMGLIGESGSGKSTTANLVLKLLVPTSGEILLFGKDIAGMDNKDMRALRKDLQIVFQHTFLALDPKMTVIEILKEPLVIHNIVPAEELDAEVERLLEMVGLPAGEKTKFPHQLSGGQNQRVIIARAIATRPKIIVCDEPVSSLDVSVQGQILNLLIKLKEELNLTYLFISHDLKVVRLMCEKTAVMHEGKIVEIGKSSEVFSKPKHEYTKKLLEAEL